MRRFDGLEISVPLSDLMLKTLINANESYAELNTIVRLYPLTEAIKNALWINELYYQKENTNSENNINNILLDTFYPNQTISNNADIMRCCMIYAKQQISEASVLTAADILKINSVFSNNNAEILKINTTMTFPFAQIEYLWEILHFLYLPDKKMPFIFDAAMAFCKIITLPFDTKIDMRTLIILFSFVFQKEYIFWGISKQWKILIDPRLKLSEYSPDEAVVKILSVFENTWRDSCELIYKIKTAANEIPVILQDKLPQLCSHNIMSLLKNNICLKNSGVQEKLGISNKTVISYLKSLEENSIISSKKFGKSKLYFNEILCEVLRKHIVNMF